MNLFRRLELGSESGQRMKGKAKEKDKDKDADMEDDKDMVQMRNTKKKCRHAL